MHHYFKKMENKFIINGVEFINLTRHPINIVIDDEILEIGKCENPILLKESRIKFSEVGGIDVNLVTLSKEGDSPEPAPNKYYIVSRAVAEAFRRGDFLIPDETVRDDNGRIIGCKSFAVIL